MFYLDHYLLTIHEQIGILPHMKPDKNVCLNCGKEISSRAKYCSDKCRMAYARKPEQNTNPNTNKAEQIVPEQPESLQPEQDLRSTLTKTDKTFYDRAMKDFGEPYYNFQGHGFKNHKMREAKCGHCGETFKSMLALNKYCSYKHYKEATTIKL